MHLYDLDKQKYLFAIAMYMHTALIACSLAQLARPAGALSPDLLLALKFLSSGWVALPRFLEEVQAPAARDRIYRAEARARVSYAHSAYEYLERQFLAPERSVRDICPAPPPSNERPEQHDLQALSQLADNAVETLSRCLRLVQAVNASATLPYFQSLNVHRLDEQINLLATSTKFGKMAAMLLQEPRISLYQTAVFVQTAAGGVARGQLMTDCDSDSST